MNIKKICVTADITRCKNGTDGVISWLSGLMSGITERICDIPFHFFSPEELKDLHMRIYAAYGIDMSGNDMKYRFLSVPQDVWQTMCFAEPNEQLLDVVKEYFGDSLVISREPAYILKKAFDILNIPHIELAMHSARYMDDIIFGVTSNIPEIYEKLKNYEINEEEFYFYADLLKSEALFRKGIPYLLPEKNYALFLAQTPVDRSLLDFKNKRIVSFMDYQEQFRKLTEEHEIVYYKSHPEYRNKEVIDFVKSFKNVEIKDNENTYYMMSWPQIKTCAAISSGTLKEAYYFGKKIECFLDQPYHYSEEIKDKSKLTRDIFITVGKQWLTAAFWADILSPVIPTKKVYAIDIRNVHNRFRRILNANQGYIDCDSVWAVKNIVNLRNSTPKVIIPKKISSVKSSIAHISTMLIPVKSVRRKLREEIINKL